MYFCVPARWEVSAEGERWEREDAMWPTCQRQKHSPKDISSATCTRIILVQTQYGLELASTEP